MILQTFVFPHFDLPVLVCFTDVSTLTPILIGLEIFILSVLVLFSSGGVQLVGGCLNSADLPVAPPHR